ncbi:MAG: hypothetical protein JRG83_16230, partial [Deltaproteobacteria bacterium]|nr:hypothetical protein [Deltaproteobacteria bacterium]
MQSAPRPPASFFDSLERGGRCTQIVGIRRPWLPDDPMLRATRAAAQRGLRIERSFLLVHRSQQQEPRLVEQLKLDRDAGIETRLLYVGPHVEALAATAPGGFEFGLWDDALCGAFITGEGAAADRVVEWRESRDDGTLGRARAFLTMLDDVVPLADSQPEGELPED